jgi:hypothetical protein
MKPKNSSLERMVVVPRRLGGEFSFWLIVAFIALIIAFIGFSTGTIFGEKFGLAQWQNLSGAEQDIIEYEQYTASQEEELARLRIGAEIDRQALEEVRLTVVEKEHELAALNKEIGFYQELMSSSTAERGLTFHGLSLTRVGLENQYKYNLVLKQLASRHNLLTVGIKMNVQGKRNGELATVDFSQISPAFKQAEEIVKFRYFVDFEGVIDLPEGFDPATVNIIARRVGTSKKIEIGLPWQIEEK